MTPQQLAAITRHGEQLLAIYPDATERDPVKLCKRLRRLESRAAAIALRLCNGPEFAGGEADRIGKAILDRVNVLLQFRESGPAVILNRDPRGYALKIRDTDMEGRTLYRDWGGYGILAPEFNADND